MNTLKELIKLAWSRWYVRTAVLVPTALWLWLLFSTNLATRGAINIATLRVKLELISASDPGTYENLEHLEWLNSLQDELTLFAVFLCLAVALGYICFSMDLAYKRLRSRKPGRS